MSKQHILKIAGMMGGALNAAFVIPEMLESITRLGKSTKFNPNIMKGFAAPKTKSRLVKGLGL